MSLKNENDCYHRALDDEPVFTLLARDPMFAKLVEEWANARQRDIKCGERPDSDWGLVDEARRCARLGAEWRRNNNGRWRKRRLGSVASLRRSR